MYRHKINFTAAAPSPVGWRLQQSSKRCSTGAFFSDGSQLTDPPKLTAWVRKRGNSCRNSKPWAFPKQNGVLRWPQFDPVLQFCSSCWLYHHVSSSISSLSKCCCRRISPSPSPGEIRSPCWVDMLLVSPFFHVPFTGCFLRWIPTIYKIKTAIYSISTPKKIEEK